MDQLPRFGKRELICLLLFTCNYVNSVWKGFLFLWVLGMGYIILLWYSLSLPLIILYLRNMEEENIAVSLCVIIIASAILRIKRDKRRPRVWARSWIRRRPRYGAHHSLIITKTRPCNIQQYFTAVKMFIFR